jgi:hypothetical protein
MLEGRIEGKRARGRHRQKYIERFKDLCGRTTADIIDSARGHDYWMEMTAKACITCDT